MADELTFLNTNTSSHLYEKLKEHNSRHHHYHHHENNHHTHYYGNNHILDNNLTTIYNDYWEANCTFHEWSLLKDRASIPKIFSIVSVLSLLVLIVVFGNFMVILAVILRRRLRSATGLLILSLAVADLLVGLVILPFSIANEVLDYWIFGELWCTVWLTMDIWMCTASIYNLVAISLDRYIAIIKPLNYPMLVTKFRARCIVAAVWIGSFIICSPSFILASSHKADHQKPCQCTPADAGKAYIIFSASSSFYLPMIVVIFVYVRIYIAACAATKSIYSGTMTVPTVNSCNGYEGKYLKSLIMQSPASLTKGTEQMPMLRIHRGSTVNALYCGKVDTLRVHNGSYTRDRNSAGSMSLDSDAACMLKNKDGNLKLTPNHDNFKHLNSTKHSSKSRSLSPNAAIQKQLSSMSINNSDEHKGLIRSASSTIFKLIKREPKKKAAGVFEKRLSIEIKAAKTVAIVTVFEQMMSYVIYTVFNREFRTCFRKFLTCSHWSNSAKNELSKVYLYQGNSCNSATRQCQTQQTISVKSCQGNSRKK
ncbi:GH10322p [Strongyloides ratti]|uniref:GH10322p n=1 Tax=Strongyloides ratti TaxID=34506 RepID=A0A090LFA9_STRRB|nr:GH10322p [Strongyloides ratti]CEF66823.1 GH10322p [Strongyloides ratti]